MNAMQALLNKAARSFDAAAMLREEDDADFAVSRAYYGYFYIAEALLLSEDKAFSRHSQVIAQYGRYFAKTSRLPPRFHGLLNRAFSLRQLADYTAAAEIDPV